MADIQGVKNVFGLGRSLASLMVIAGSATAVAAGSDVSYQSDGESFEGYWVSAGEQAPLVVLIHDWDGLTAYEKQRADMLAAEGYNVFAVDMYGEGIRPEEISHRKALMGDLFKNRDKMRALFQSGINAAASQGGNLSQMAVMGYCFGGAVMLEAARSGIEARNFAGFHAGLKTPAGQDFSKTTGTISLYHGAADTSVSMQDVSNLVGLLESSNIDHEVNIYGGAPHAFTVMGSSRYHEAADKKSWDHYLDNLKTTFEK